MKTLTQHVLDEAALTGSDVVASINAMIDTIDKKMSVQINAIVHHPDYQQLESAWRGLHYLVNNTETDEMLKIRVMNISKQDLHETLRRFKGAAWNRSPIFKKLYDDELAQPGGEPYGCLVGDYYFDHGAPDVDTLAELSKISAAIHAPFIAAPAPSLFQMDSWGELSHSRDLTKMFSTPEYAGWRALRESEDARYLGMAMPRFLARSPYGAKTNPVQGFAFEEDTSGADISKYTWASAAYLMAANITRSFRLYGWCSRIRGIESGGAVDGLPTRVFSTDGGVDMKCPTEIAIDGDRHEFVLAKNGFMPLLHKKNSGFAAFIGAVSLQKPRVYDDPDATANANLAARLPYLFAACRFAHYVKCIVRDRFESFQGHQDMQQFLQRWLNQYVDGDPAHSSEDEKARRPLAAAKVLVTESREQPGYFESSLLLRPEFQLGFLTGFMQLTTCTRAGRRTGA